MQDAISYYLVAMDFDFETATKMQVGPALSCCVGVLTEPLSPSTLQQLLMRAGLRVHPRWLHAATTGPPSLQSASSMIDMKH